MTSEREELTFALDEFLAAQKALRQNLGLREERFPISAFIGMISDEIDQMRRAGRTDEDVAATISAATGRMIDAEDILRFYASPKKRHSGG
ncbi:MAG: hypothetical protein JOZ16_18570 [Methylobacteriaceae bacterium]|nr:hypothetical protein [Methylobacteriaceae bacterium]